MWVGNLKKKEKRIGLGLGLAANVCVSAFVLQEL
jgi:hypothetical protein